MSFWCLLVSTGGFSWVNRLTRWLQGASKLHQVVPSTFLGPVIMTKKTNFDTEELVKMRTHKTAWVRPLARKSTTAIYLCNRACVLEAVFYIFINTGPWIPWILTIRLIISSTETSLTHSHTIFHIYPDNQIYNAFMSLIESVSHRKFYVQCCFHLSQFTWEIQIAHAYIVFIHHFEMSETHMCF